MTLKPLAALAAVVLTAAAIGGGAALVADGASTFDAGQRVQFVAGGELATVDHTTNDRVVVYGDASGATLRAIAPEDLKAYVPPAPPPTTTATTPPATTPTVPSSTSYLGFADFPPDASFRPYSSASPFNLRVPANPVLHPQSAAIVSTLLGSSGVPGNLSTAQTPTKDYGHPIYYSKTTDPLVKLNVGSYAVSGTVIPVPAYAQAAAGGDGHMGIVTPDGWEYDLWHVTGRTATSVTAEIGYRQRYDGLGIVTPALVNPKDPTRPDLGDKLLGGTTASYFGLHAGIIRGPELAAGEIDHALFLVIGCGSSSTSFGFGTVAPGANKRGGSGSSVYPAFKGDAACSTGTRPPMGARFYLAMTDAEIDATTAPSWEKTIARAAAHYGLYFGDTGGPGFALQFDSGLTYTAAGRTNPLVSVATAAGLPKDATYGYTFRFGTGTKPIPWAARMRVLPPPTP